jgi:outer membrane lipoprotein-sorting protein
MDCPSSITRRLFLFLTGGLLAKLGYPSAVAEESKENALSATDIVRRMAETYKSCKSYQDSGTVTTIFHHEDGKQHTSSKPFTTAFVRPDRFRFEFKDSFDGHKWHRYIVWARGKDVRTWWDIRPKMEGPESLALALAGATGVSGGSAHTIPTLLIPDQIGGRGLTELTGLKRLEDADLGDIHCFRVQGRQVIRITRAERDEHRQKVQKLTGKIPEESEHGPTVVWIVKATFLVRRIEQKVQFESFRTESTTEYNPLLDTPIGEKQLEFGKPEANED